MDNKTMVTEFFLLGFTSLHSFKVALFILVFLVYLGTLVGNLLIVTLVSSHPILHTPMYFFLGHLSLCDIVFTTNIVPNMLHIIIKEGSKLSLVGCVAQYHIFGFSASSESFLLTVMSYDRYLAICHPLRYSAIMDFKLQLKCITTSWLLSLIITLLSLIFIYQLQFCGPHVINHFFCDVAPLIELSCSDTTAVKIEIYVGSIPIVLLPFIFVIWTYAYIFFTIIRIPSTTGRQKALSTCSSHLTVVCLYYGTLFAVYVVPTNDSSQDINKIMSLMYTVVTPLFNPMIYSLRNQDIRAILKKHINRTS